MLIVLFQFFSTFPQCIVIEDALAGVQAAQAAKMRYRKFSRSFSIRSDG